MSPLLELWLSDALAGDDTRDEPRSDARRRRDEPPDALVPGRETASQVPGLSDAQVVAGIRAGDVDVFSAMWRAYWVPLTQLAFLHVRDRDAADDLVSDVLEQIWNRRAAWNVRGSVTAYLVIAVRNRAMNILRSDRRRGAAHLRSTSDDVSAVAEPIDTRERRAAVAAAVRALPERHRTILMLRWRLRESWEDVATVLGISVSAAKVQHHRAIHALRDHIGDRINDL